MITLFDKPDNVWELIANGLPWTLTLAVSSLAIGFVLAVGLALLRLSTVPLCSAPHPPVLHAPIPLQLPLPR